MRRICTCTECGGLDCIPSKGYITCPTCWGDGYTAEEDSNEGV